VSADDLGFSVRAPAYVAPFVDTPSTASVVTDDAPRSEEKTRGLGEDVFDVGQLSFNPFGDSATSPQTTPTNTGTKPAASGTGPLLTDAQAGSLGGALLGGVEDLAHQFGIGPGSEATQAREAAAAQAKQQQQLIVGAVVVIAIGVVLWKFGVFSGPSAPAAVA
jgi:hypothetical protein